MKKKIMIVDDEVDFLEVVKLNLEDTGQYEVKTLSSGKDILAEVRRFNPDVLLLDMLMPEVGGLEICDALNCDPKGLSLPIIVISALDKEVDKIKAFRMGIVDYLVKPVGDAVIIDKIERAIKRKSEK